MNRTRRTGRPTAVAALLLLLPACSPGNGLTMGRVRGTVTFKGEPITNGTVFFMPDEAQGTVGPPAVGAITADGSFVMSTESAGDGAIVGHHLVGLAGLEEEPISDRPAPKPQDDPAGFMRAKAGAAAQASRSSGPAAETFTDKGGKTYRSLIPMKLSNPTESGLAVEVERGSNTFNFVIDESGTVRVNP
ncbi:hypothetical protein [Tautonia plasticadhaerens]|uniref:Uncharacterized protein n=1 Tax=Tautonia plasticadhaerens TaxID=2527974 RepID=A0A518H1F2_9BACT|nr:hypothetical protein [Tautonia plasticadhaerens]QDV34663.1 hypothetical protein ElP_25550 [Tautonia plasticadhaerens]